MKGLLNVYKALSDETRLRILKLLEDGELCVCELVAALDMVQPKVSFHLGVLKESGLIQDRKSGRWSRYSISEGDLFNRFVILSTLERITDEEMKDDMARLEEYKAKKKNGVDMKEACA